ncbi:MAG: hypothetical protein ACTHL8_19160 [Burkholderiaceae bacterium]
MAEKDISIDATSGHATGRKAPGENEKKGVGIKAPVGGLNLDEAGCPAPGEVR